MITYRNLLDYFKSQKNQEAVILSRGFGSGSGLCRPRLSFRCSRINYYSNGKAAAETDKDLGITVGIDWTIPTHIFPVIRVARWFIRGENNKYSLLRATCASWVNALEGLPNSMLSHELMLVDESSRNVAVNPMYGGIRIGPVDATKFIYRCIDETTQDYEIILDSRSRKDDSWCAEYIVNGIVPGARDQYHISPDWTELNNYQFIVIDAIKRSNVRYYLTNNYDNEGLYVE